MRALVTGGAGFVGSTLCERLLGDGHSVVAIDSFTDYYDPALKRYNVRDISQHERFTLVEDDLGMADLPAIMSDIDVVFHQAAQPGVRLSWAEGFGS